MKLVFERTSPGRHLDLLPACDVPSVTLSANFKRSTKPNLPELSEVEVGRHYTELAKQTHGVNDGFYPLGSCTMKYNPRINEEMAALPGFTGIHPLQDDEEVQGCLEVIDRLEKALCEITAMDNVTLQPAAGAHGEFTGLQLIRAYHQHRNDTKRTKIIVPDSAHGTNPASAVMVGFDVINIPSDEKGCVDLEALRNAVGEDTAGLMLTNPNTVGLFDPNIAEITKIVHEAGGLCYYDGANLNAVMGIVRPGDMGFDCIHMNLHKTFSTPHGGGGPGAGPVGCKSFLSPYLPGELTVNTEEGFKFTTPEETMGRVRTFHGNFLVGIRALCYILSLGKEGIPAAAQGAVLNANYMMSQLANDYDMAFTGPCMHEFVMTLDKLHKETGVSALDAAKRLLDFGIHPPTMYFPLIVHEALMVEPTETESIETLDEAVAIFKQIMAEAKSNPDMLHSAPHNTPIGRPNEVKAARTPILRYTPEV
ncbi:MAG: aminomethyl-transferring glycine dehydrogenase subunit GcvPB [Erysipelotrichaceae bacterium]|nr:aminomethyl-transferring glycine dehydrogenase subunit GcvPB [Erysipelotrichaceae bacterium]